MFLRCRRAVMTSGYRDMTCSFRNEPQPISRKRQGGVFRWRSCDATVRVEPGDPFGWAVGHAQIFTALANLPMPSVMVLSSAASDTRTIPTERLPKASPGATATWYSSTSRLQNS